MNSNYNNNDQYISSLIKQLNKIKEERNKIEEKPKNEEEEEKNKKEKEFLFNNILNQFNNNNNDNNIFNNSNYNNNEFIEEQNNKILYPKDQNDEEEQYRLALKESEEEAWRQSKKEKEEKELFYLAIEESKKYNTVNNIKIKEEEFDEEYGICPITQEYMENPVLTPSGNYYEKSAILDWINKNQTDPLTREHLTVNMLVEDYEYKNQIIEYRKKFNKL